MRKSILLFVSLLVALSLMLAACGPAAAPVEEPAEEAVEEPAEEAVEEPAEEPVVEEAAEVVEIRWFVGLGTGTDPVQVEIQQAVVDAFNETHDDIELVLEVVPYDAARDTLSTQIAAGNGPDIVGPVGIGGSNFFYGQWLDLTPLLNATGFDTSVFNEALVEFYQTEEGQVGLPFAVFPTGLYYQKGAFDEAGLNYPPANIGDPYIWPDGTEVEWSWETLTEVAKQLTVDVNGLTPLDDGFDRDSIIQVGYCPQWSGPAVVGTFWEPGLTYEGEEGAYTVALPDAWKAAWRWWFDGMWSDEPFIADGALAGSPEYGGGNVFNSGKAAMAQTQLWYTCCVGDAGENWDVAAFPSYNGVIHGRMDADTFRIWKGTPNPEEAFEVLTYLIGPEGVVPLMIGDEANPGGAYGAFPALTELQPLFIDAKSAQYPFVENWDLFLQALDYPDVPSAEAWMPNINEAWNRIETFGNLIQNDGSIDFDAELATLEADLEVIFNK
jgi:multiple sugar transport system substrate-binding protein